MTFKLKLKENKTPGRFVGLKFKAGNTIYTITSYNYREQDGVWFYRRNSGGDTPEAQVYTYTESEVIKNLQDHWELLPQN